MIIGILWQINSMNKKLLIFLSFSAFFFSQKKVDAQAAHISKVWVPDLGNGNYKNPILFADYSDPDVCRVGKDYYLIASSFDAVPGLPILHSNDLVNWTIIGHALLRQPPYKHFSKTQHGNGVWAPAIRYHNDSFYIYYPDPDFGIYVVKAKTPTDVWSKPILVEPGKGLEDPCPFWDKDGQGYLVHAFAGSRAGIRNILVLHKLNRWGTKMADEGVIVYDGHKDDPGIEGPKMYKRNGYYYIFAPAGGVSGGYQMVLRSKNIWGPYERKTVMHQGSTAINGPHQGAWVTTPDEKQSWFIHFRDMGAYGRVDYLEPMIWKNDWPIIGIDKDGEGIGEPVTSHRKPDVGKAYPLQTPQTSDEFNGHRLGLQWQWQANSKATWYYLTSEGALRLYAQPLLKDDKNYWDVPNILMQKFPADKFTATTKLTFHAIQNQDKVGFVIMGMDYAYLSLTKVDNGFQVSFATCKKANEGAKEIIQTIKSISDSTIYFRVNVSADAKCQFSYSLDGSEFVHVGNSFQAKEGRWIGAKLGLFCTSSGWNKDSGFADFDWFRIEPLMK